MHYTARILILAACLVLIFWVQSPAQTPADSLEAAVAACDSLITSLESQRAGLGGRLEETSQAIAQLKADESLGFLQRRRLEGLLKDFQRFGEEADSLDKHIRALSVERDSLLQDLWYQYDAEANRLASTLETRHTTLTEQERQEIVNRLAELRELRATISARLPSAEVKAPPYTDLAIQPGDDYQRIRDKADLLKDREDQARGLVRQIEARIKQLKDERELRERLGDFVDDVALFEQRDEPLAAAQQTTRIGEAGVFNHSTAEEKIRTATVRETGPITALGERVWEIDPSKLTSAEVEDIIRELEKQKTLHLAQADSLAARAKMFYEQAQELRSLERGPNP